ncbi:MAG TPA: hypothetical protein VEA59_05850 [Patescibacteria group bacterium]|nr:hypothetical protein [Patescibacteria group bacterium]
MKNFLLALVFALTLCNTIFAQNSPNGAATGSGCGADQVSNSNLFGPGGPEKKCVVYGGYLTIGPYSGALLASYAITDNIFLVGVAEARADKLYPKFATRIAYNKDAGIFVFTSPRDQFLSTGLSRKLSLGKHLIIANLGPKFIWGKVRKTHAFAGISDTYEISPRLLVFGEVYRVAGDTVIAIGATHKVNNSAVEASFFINAEQKQVGFSLLLTSAHK